MKKIKDNLFYIFMVLSIFIFYFRYFVIQNNVINYCIYVLAGCSLILWGIDWLIQKYSFRERIIHIIIILYIIGIYLFSGMKYEYLIFSILAIIGMKGKSFKKIMKIFFVVYTICICVQIFLLIFGVVKDSLYEKISSHRLIVTHTYGFTHGNTAFAVLFTYIFSYMYYRFRKLTVCDFLFWEIISILLYFVFYSRTGLICITMLLSISFVFKKCNVSKSKGFKFIMNGQIFIVPMFFFFTLIMSTKFYGTAFSQIIDDFISDRLRISNVYINLYGIKWFPQSFELLHDLAFDNTYSFIMVSFGSIFSISLVIAFVYMSIILIKQKKYYELCMVTLFAFYSYSEKMFINCFRNPTILFLAYIIYNDFHTEVNNEKDCNNLLLFWNVKKRLQKLDGKRKK